MALCLAMLFSACGFTLGQAQYKVLYSFVSGTSPTPTTSLALDNAGNLFGITHPYGNYPTAFELSPNSNGTWTETTLYIFCIGQNCPNGESPDGTLVLDSKGDLYGTAAFGGAPCANGFVGCGVIYELLPPSLPGGAWTETVLYSFCQVEDCEDGISPSGKLTFDRLGNLYGTTETGGVGGSGTVFELSPGSDGTWTETTLYSFCASAGCLDGGYPYEGVAFDKSGNLYGTTSGGGSTGYGTIFKLSPGASWIETVLYTFIPPPGTYGKNTAAGPVSIDPLGYHSYLGQ